jgi:type IV pilus assembly protein PilC
MDWILYSWPTLLTLALGLRVALKLHYGARGPDANDPIYHFVSILSWVLFVLGLVPIVVGGAITVVGVLVLALGIATLVEVVVQHRAVQRRSVCTLLALFLERRQQISAPLFISGTALRGIVGRAAKRLFHALNAGVPLADAVRSYSAALPREAMAYVAAGQTVEAEAAALRELSKADQSGVDTLWRACIDRISYLSCVLVTMVAVVTFLIIKIVPAYWDIFEEFSLELPPLTMLAFSVSQDTALLFAVPMTWAFIVLLLVAAVVEICYLCDVPILQAWGDRLFRGRRTADVLRILAVATEERRPIADVLFRVAQTYPSETIRSQLRPAAAVVVSGGDWPDALRKYKIVSTAEAALLRAAARAGNLPWALRQVAKRREKRAIYRLHNFIQIVYPVLILMVGGVVAFYFLALFIPVVQLIQSLT